MTRKSHSRREILKAAAAASATASFGNIFIRRASAVTPAARAAAQSELDQLLSGAVKSKAVIPGVVAMVATGDGILYQGAFGKRDVQTGSDMKLDSVFWLASMTKAITAAAVMQLVDQNRWTLFSSFEKLLPELPQLWAPKVLMGFDSRGQPRLREAKIPIDLGYLLTHTAGFAYDIWNPDMARYIKYANLPPIVSCKNAALNTPLVSEPGSAWHYGTSIDLVGRW